MFRNLDNSQCHRGVPLRVSVLRQTQVSIAECHGTGTALGDPIEVGALMAVMPSPQHSCDHRDPSPVSCL